MKVDEIYPNRWLNVLDLKGKDWTLTVEKLTIEKIGAPPKQEEKPILYFVGAKKQLVANKTNLRMIAKCLHDDETSNWPGQQITLYPTTIQVSGKKTDAIRVREQTKTIAALPDPVVEGEPDERPSETEEEDESLWVDVPDVKERIEPDEIDLVESWKTPHQAEKWAVESGACQSMQEARIKWDGIVEKHFGNRLLKQDFQAAAIMFYMSQSEKLGEQPSLLTGDK